MNQLKSFKQISAYRPKALSSQTHKNLLQKLNLKQFKLTEDFTYLKITFSFPQESYTQIVDKMNIIGQVADTMDHHPEWTLKNNSLQINLSTHQCQGKVSIKDYILASWIENIWNQKSLQQVLTQNWNEKKINIDQIK